MMSDQQIRFDDGAAYEQMMGKWSRIAGDVFLDWLAPSPGLDWVDVGCGNGAFTELLVDRRAPRSVRGVDVSEGQLAYARTRHVAGIAEFQIGSAMELPYGAASADAAVMALVLFFVPEPHVGVAEMARVVRPGGLVCAYAWDIEGGGFPMEKVFAAMIEHGLSPLRPPSASAANIDSMRALWERAGLQQVETRQIRIQRHFRDFEEFWQACLLGGGTMAALNKLEPATLQAIKEASRAKAGGPADDGLWVDAWANAVKGVVAG
jgi:ubiquinone/menaquinone biosynthesis C-methylase UbiE